MSPSYFLQRVCSFYLPLGSDAYRSCRRALYLLHCTLASCLALWYDIVHTYLLSGSLQLETPDPRNNHRTKFQGPVPENDDASCVEVCGVDPKNAIPL